MRMRKFPLEEGREYLLNVGDEEGPAYIVGMWIGYKFISLDNPDGGDHMDQQVVLEYIPL